MRRISRHAFDEIGAVHMGADSRRAGPSSSGRGPVSKGVTASAGRQLRSSNSRLLVRLRGHNVLQPATCLSVCKISCCSRLWPAPRWLVDRKKGMGAPMRRDNSRPIGTGQLSASIYFHAPPGIGWRLHISKVAAEIRVATPGGISRRLRNRGKSRTD